MIMFPEILVSPAEQAGIKVPENLEQYKKEDFPYWFVYCSVQLGAGMPYPSAHWDNAKVIASVPESDIMSVTYGELIENYGLHVST